MEIEIEIKFDGENMALSAQQKFKDASSGWDTFEPENSIFGAADGGFHWIEGDSLAPPCQAELDIVESILDFAQLTQESVLFDLGCGDGRICILGSQVYGCKSTGAEIEESLVAKFRANVEKQKVEHLVSVFEGDLREVDLRGATHIILYLLPESIEEITPMLVQAVNFGATLICNTWGPRSFQPVDRRLCGANNQVNLFKYTKDSIPNMESVLSRRCDSEPMDLDSLMQTEA